MIIDVTSRSPVWLRLRIVLAAIGLLSCLALLPNIGSTEAAWRDPEFGRGSFTAGTVLPATGLTCTGSVLTGKVTFNWNTQTGGVTRTGFVWTVTGVVSQTGTTGPNTKTTQLTVPLVTLGNATFSLRAVGPAGSNWQSTPVTKTFSVGTGGIISC